MRMSKGGPQGGHGRTVSTRGARAMPGAMLAALLAVGAAATLAGCAAVPTAAVEERTDERTAVTVATLPKPLLFTGARGDDGAMLDLSLAPFELNRQGRKTWYVWVSVLGADLGKGEPRLRLVSGTETVLDLAPEPATFMPPLSRAPYEKPAGWATERYYAITTDDLARLQGRTAFDAEVVAPSGSVWRFTPWDAQFDALSAYLGEQLQGRVATR
jgi:hypothetical protein